jgi:hypothetical protein
VSGHADAAAKAPPRNPRKESQGRFSHEWTGRRNLKCIRQPTPQPLVGGPSGQKNELPLGSPHTIPFIVAADNGQRRTESLPVTHIPKFVNL